MEVIGDRLLVALSAVQKSEGKTIIYIYNLVAELFSILAECKYPRCEFTMPTIRVKCISRQSLYRASSRIQCK